MSPPEDSELDTDDLWVKEDLSQFNVDEDILTQDVPKATIKTDAPDLVPPLATKHNEIEIDNFESDFHTMDQSSSDPIADIEHITEKTTDIPIIEPRTEAPATDISQIDQKMIEDMIDKKVTEKVNEIIEDVVWKVVPELAKQIIEKELNKLLNEDDN